jgi:hypothetical protein
MPGPFHERGAHDGVDAAAPSRTAASGRAGLRRPLPPPARAGADAVDRLATAFAGAVGQPRLQVGEVLRRRHECDRVVDGPVRRAEVRGTRSRSKSEGSTGANVSRRIAVRRPW